MVDWVKEHNKDKKGSYPEKEFTQGRPKVANKQKRKPRFTVNLNDEELLLIQKASDACGQSQASLARTALIKEAKLILNK